MVEKNLSALAFKKQPDNVVWFDFKKFKCYVLFEIKPSVYLLVFIKYFHPVK